jgi:glycosyltransferase involved in cell wall biosynthesis
MRWIGDHGIGRFAAEIQKRLPFLIPFEHPRRPWDPFDPLLLSAALWRHAPSLFFSPGYNSPAVSARPFVFTLHDLNHLRVPENSNALKRAYYRYCIRPACDRAAYVLTVSEYSKAEIVQWAGIPAEKVINVGNGVDYPFIPLGPAYDIGGPYLLYVGSRKANKNIPRLLKAFAVSGVYRDIRLVLSGGANDAVMKQVYQLGLADSITFADASSNESLAELYRGAHAFLFVSFYEGFGLPPLEAMACGTPVLTSNVCSLPEVVGDAAILVDPYDVDAIADGIRRIAGETDLRTELKRKGLAQARKFSWDQTACKTRQVLEAAIAETRTA